MKYFAITQDGCQTVDINEKVFNSQKELYNEIQTHLDFEKSYQNLIHFYHEIESLVLSEKLLSLLTSPISHDHQAYSREINKLLSSFVVNSRSYIDQVSNILDKCHDWTIETATQLIRNSEDTLDKSDIKFLNALRNCYSHGHLDLLIRPPSAYTFTTMDESSFESSFHLNDTRILLSSDSFSRTLTIFKDTKRSLLVYIKEKGDRAGFVDLYPLVIKLLILISNVTHLYRIDSRTNLSQIEKSIRGFSSSNFGKIVSYLIYDDPLTDSRFLDINCVSKIRDFRRCYKDSLASKTISHLSVYPRRESEGNSVRAFLERRANEQHQEQDDL